MPDMPEDLPDPQVRTDEDFARALDQQDPLAGLRERFCIPRRETGEPVLYFCGNSLGLMPRAARQDVCDELDAWSRLAVDAHFHGRHPWYSYHEQFRGPAARLVGARPHEVVLMNSLTVNLHLLMVSFYRPTPQRFRILIEDCAFPSDLYAVQTQLRWHGLDPDEGLVVARPRPGEYTLRMEDIEALLEHEGQRIALVLMGAVNYFTGQVLDIARITAAGRRQGCVVGFDLAHAAGNVPLELHDWDVDFAAWCSYKYLNCGPGAVAGCFVHERHARDTALPRFGGWWGNDPQTRFRMHLNDRFEPVPSADGWQLSNPPILSMAAMRAALDIFDEVGMQALREKSLRLTGYLRFLLEDAGRKRTADRPALEIITPRDPAGRGAQLSLLAHTADPQRLQQSLQTAGVIADFRPPNVIRVAPVPLYNTYHEVWRLAQTLRTHAAR